jgi:hypothetical protein
MRQWERPRVLAVGALSEGLGHCFSGSTESSEMCANGDQTDDPADGGNAHACQNGGYAGEHYGGCGTGSNVHNGGA